MAGLTTGFRAFREEMVSSPSQGGDDFTNFDSRRLRYSILWSMYENTTYRNIQDWATTYKTNYGLYKYIRNIYNPAFRLAEFWKAHTWGGALDPEAEDTGALPIITDNPKLRPAIADIWVWSNLGIAKDICTLQGAVMGDAIIKIIDAIENEKVYLELIHPGTIADLQKDRFGNIKGYTIEETRLHPVSKRPVTYKETAERGAGQEVIYKTYLNNSPYEWNGETAEWMEPYGFIPMVHVQHNNVGQGWGWSEFHPARSKMHETDDLASMLSDQIRKSINPKWLFTGAKASTATARTSTIPTTTRPEPGREEQDALYAADPQAQAIPLVAPLNIEGTVLHITEILKELERDYPELKFDALRASGEISGQALRVARQPTETKVAQRRANYDNALVRAQQMAVAIGGMRGYFPGFGLDSFERGALDHSIGNRSVFSVDPIDKMEEDKVFWEAAGLATKAGATLDVILQDAGWEDKRIKVFLGTPEYKAKLKAMRMALGDDQGEASGGTPTGDIAPENLESVVGLNGIQIKAALEILTGLTAGEVTREAATELLVAMGMDRAKALIIVTSTEKLPKPEPEPAPLPFGAVAPAVPAEPVAVKIR